MVFHRILGASAIVTLTTALTPLNTNAVAQTVLDDIVIESATLSGEQEKLNETGTSASVITARQIDNRKAVEIEDVLRTVPGLTVNRTGAAGGLTEVRIRGAEANHTLVLVDGIEVNNASDGAFDFSNLDAASIERVEVLRGPQSGIYGSKAIGGVINIITKNGKGAPRVEAQLEAGSFDSRSGRLFVGGGNEKAYGALTLTGRSTNGTDITRSINTIDESDAFDRRSAFLKAGVMPFEGLTVEVVGRVQNKNDDTDFSLFADSPDIVRFDEKLGSVRARHELFNSRFVQTLRADYQARDIDFVSGFGTSTNISQRRTYTYQAHVELNDPASAFSSRLTGKIDHNIESFETASAFGSGVDQRDRTGYAAEYTADFAKRTFFTAAVRHDTVDVFDDKTTYRFTVAQLFGTGTKLHASYGTALKLPTLIEQFGFTPGVFIGNPDLLPETATGWDIGITQTLADGRLSVDLTYFQNTLEDRIVSSGQFARNLLGETENRGIEISGTIRVVPGITLAGSYTYLDSEDPDGRVSIRRPEHSASLSLNAAFANGRGNLNVTAEYVGEQQDTDFRNFLAPVRVTLDDYIKLDVAARFRVTQNLEAYARVENLLDEDYQEVFGFDAAGIAAYAGIKLHFGGENERLVALK